MNKITTLDKVALTALRPLIDAHLAELGAKIGIDLKLGSGTFGDGAEASFKLILKVDDPEVKAKAAAAEWSRHCRYIGLNYNDVENSGLRPEDLGTEFSYAGGVYRTTGIATKGKGSQKFPILCEIVTAGRSGKAGEIRMLPEAAVPLIRAATDAKAKKAA